MAMKISEGKSQTGFNKGTKLYRIVWKGYLPEAATWEPASNIGDDILAEYEASLEAEAELEAEEALELEEDEDGDEAMDASD